MGAKSEVLAKQFEAKAQEAASVLEKVSDADWRKVTEAEKWTVGVTAHHLARAFGAVAVTARASGTERCVLLPARSDPKRRELSRCAVERAVVQPHPTDCHVPAGSLASASGTDPELWHGAPGAANASLADCVTVTG